MTPAKNKKTSKAFKKKASLPKKSESGSNNKNIARVLVGVVLIFCVIESFNLFQTEPVKVKAQLTHGGCAPSKHGQG